MKCERGSSLTSPHRWRANYAWGPFQAKDLNAHKVRTPPETRQIIEARGRLCNKGYALAPYSSPNRINSRRMPALYSVLDKTQHRRSVSECVHKFSAFSSKELHTFLWPCISVSLREFEVDQDCFNFLGRDHVPQKIHSRITLIISGRSSSAPKPLLLVLSGELRKLTSTDRRTADPGLYAE